MILVATNLRAMIRHIVRCLIVQVQYEDKAAAGIAHYRCVNNAPQR